MRHNNIVVMKSDYIHAVACIIVAIGTKSVIEDILEDFPGLYEFTKTYICKWAILASLVYINTKNKAVSLIIPTAIIACVYLKRIKEGLYLNNK